MQLIRLQLKVKIFLLTFCGFVLNFRKIYAKKLLLLLYDRQVVLNDSEP